jgi:hypothetical protein
MEPDELDRELRKQRQLGLSDAQKTDISQKFRRSQDAMSKVFLRRVRLATIIWAFLIAFYYQLSAPNLLEEFSGNPELVKQLEDQGRDMLERSDDNGESPPSGNGEPSEKIYFQLQPWESGWCFFYHSASADPNCKSAAEPPKNTFERVQWSNIFGILITMLLLSLGAPFWFDMLKSVVNLKDTLAKHTDTDNAESGAAEESKSTDDRIELLMERMHATSNPIVKASLQKEINDLRLIKAEFP